MFFSRKSAVRIRRSSGALLLLAVVWSFAASGAHYHAAPAPADVATGDSLSASDGASVCWACSLTHAPSRVTLRALPEPPAFDLSSLDAVEAMSGVWWPRSSEARGPPLEI